MISPAIADILSRQVRNIVTIEFNDGDVVEARLLAVDLTEHDDVILDVLRVVRTNGAARYDPTNYYRAMVDTIISVQPGPAGAAR